MNILNKCFSPEQSFLYKSKLHITQTMIVKNIIIYIHETLYGRIAVRISCTRGCDEIHTKSEKLYSIHGHNVFAIIIINKLSSAEPVVYTYNTDEKYDRFTNSTRFGQSYLPSLVITEFKT